MVTGDTMWAARDGQEMPSPDLRRRQSMSSADLRRHNRALILNFLRDHGPAARSEIAEATGLVRGAVTGLVTGLLAEHLVKEVDSSLRRGRPAPMLAVSGERQAVLVLELTVDRISTTCADLAGDEVLREVIDHRFVDADPERVADLMAAGANRAIAAASDRGQQIVRAIVVVSAPVSQDEGVVAISVDLGWHDVPLGALLRQRIPGLQCPVRYVGDAPMGGWAEYQHLRTTELPDLSDMLYLKSDTGIGGLAVAAGQVLRGAHGIAFVPGHLAVVPSGEQCDCGQRGCLVTVAGPEAVLAEAGLSDLLATSGQTVAEAELLARAAAGNTSALAALASAGEWLGRVLNILLIDRDPEVVVLGGYWAPAFDYLKVGLQRTLSPFAAPLDAMFPLSVIRPASLGDRANLVGALDRAIRATFDDLA